MDLSKATEEQIREFKQDWQKDCWYIHTSDRRLGFAINWCHDNVDPWHYSSIKIENKIFFCFREDAEEIYNLMKQNDYVCELKRCE